MQALILAAGRGERMRPLTDLVPKPLIEVGGDTLIVRHLERLAACGVRKVVVNTSWLASQFPAALGDGSRWGLHLIYSYEGAAPLETGGGMLAALALLDDAPFLVVNGDVWIDYDFAQLPRSPAGLAHLVMVDTAAHVPQGDFALDPQGLLRNDGSPRLTYAGIGVYRPQLLQGWREIVGMPDAIAARPPRFRLLPLLRTHTAEGLISGEHFRGRWTDVGTPARLQALRDQIDPAPARQGSTIL